MAIVSSIKDALPGYGSPGTYAKREGVATNVGTVVITVPAAGTFLSNGNGPGVRRGRVRLKTVSVVAGGTIQAGVITATDGTNLFTISPQQNVLAANILLDMTVDFNMDFLATSISVTVIAGTSNSVHDVEVAGTA